MPPGFSGPRSWGTRLVWFQAEVVVLATDLAEFVGAAIGMRLLFGMPVLPSTVLTAVASLLLLELRRPGVRDRAAVVRGVLHGGRHARRRRRDARLPRPAGAGAPAPARDDGAGRAGPALRGVADRPADRQPGGISLGVPVALFLLVHFCRDRSLMGPLVNAPLTTRVAGISAAVVAVLGCCLPFTL
jgi:hypothetical protein